MASLLTRYGIMARPKIPPIEQFDGAFGGISPPGGTYEGTSNTRTALITFSMRLNRSGSTSVTWEISINGGSFTAINFSSNISITEDDTVQFKATASSSVNSTITLDDVSNSIDTFDTIIAAFFDACYLTTAMVDYYGYEDDGIELNSMRAVRQYMYESKNPDYLKMLSDYKKESYKIIDYIEKENLGEQYYPQIKDIVLQIVQLIKNNKNQEAIDLYWRLYLRLKDEILKR